MKLIDLLLEIEKTNPAAFDNGHLHSKVIEGYKEKFFQCEEFKSVARINYLPTPSFAYDKETNEPLIYNPNFIGGETLSETTTAVALDDTATFNKVVDIYSFQIHRVYNKKQEINKPGVWVFPTDYDETDFTATNEVRVIWNPDQMREVMTMLNSKETVEDRLTRLFAEALKNGPNIPCDYQVIFRGSARSLNQPVPLSATKPEERENIVS